MTLSRPQQEAATGINNMSPLADVPSQLIQQRLLSRAAMPGKNHFAIGSGGHVRLPQLGQGPPSILHPKVLDLLRFGQWKQPQVSIGCRELCVAVGSSHNPGSKQQN